MLRGGFELRWSFCYKPVNGCSSTGWDKAGIIVKRKQSATWLVIQYNKFFFFFGWMDGWMTCGFTSFLTVFQSYPDDVWMIMKGCVQWNSVYGWEDFTSSVDRTRSARSVGQRLTNWATGAPFFSDSYFSPKGKRYPKIFKSKFSPLPICVVRFPFVDWAEQLGACISVS